MRRVPIQARSRATVDAIVEAARRLLVSGGYAALNTQYVATRAGVGIGSLYEYFEDKEDLAQAAFVLELRHIDQRLRAEGASKDRDARLDAVIADTEASYARIVALADGMPAVVRDEVTTLATASLEAAIRQRYAVILTQCVVPMGDDQATASAICARIVTGLIGRFGADETEDRTAMAKRANRVVRLYLGLPVAG